MKEDAGSFKGQVPTHLISTQKAEGLKDSVNTAVNDLLVIVISDCISCRSYLPITLIAFQTLGTKNWLLRTFHQSFAPRAILAASP